MIYSKKLRKISASIMAFLMVCLFLVPETRINAKDSFLSGYIQVVYNQQNGIGSSEINSIYQSSSGYIWIGTDGGLYRSKGSDFQSINLWDTERTDVYSINCITQDVNQRMWIGTANYGLFCIYNGEIYHFQEEYYNGIKCINDIAISETGTVYVATPKGIYTCDIFDDGGSLSLYADESISTKNFSELVCFGENVWAVCEPNSIFVLGPDSVLGVIDTEEILGDYITSIDVVEDKVYLGSAGREIAAFSNAAEYTIYSTTVESINKIVMDSKGVLWVCGDSGICYKNGDDFVSLNDCAIESYICDMIEDYEGNYWFASSRMGVLFLAKSKFVDYNMQTGMQETMVNCVDYINGLKYIGTEDGLVIYDANNERVSNELTDYLGSASIRHIMHDAGGNVWISTYRRFGIIRVDKEGNIVGFAKGSELPSTVINCTLELKNGYIAAGTDGGVAIIDKSGNVKKTYTEKDGLANSTVKCLYQLDEKTLLFGTDGGGMYSVNIESDRIECFDTNSGLNSNSVSVIKGGTEGIWIGTDNGLCFLNESVRSISNIEYNNNIYDLVFDGEDVYVIGSLGVLKTSEPELLGNKGISSRYLDVSDGLTKTLNAVSSTSIDKDGIMYLCCNNGICTLDTRNTFYNEVPPKLKVTSIDVDGKIYEFDDLEGSLEIPDDATRITIDFAVFSYSNRKNITVEYCLEGFDNAPIVLNGTDTMRAVYTNLDGGDYEFVIRASNGDGTECISEVSFELVKSKSFFENKWAKILILFIVFSVLALLSYVIFKILKTLKNKDSALELLSKEHEKVIKSSSAKNDYLANMSNEIKTPINAIVSRADELMKLIEEEDARYEGVKYIFETGNDIIEKVDDIILLAKIEAGRMSVVENNYSVSDLIYELSEEAVNSLSDRPIKFFVEMGEDINDNLLGDSEKLRDILKRLIENAVMYTKEGSITVSVDCYPFEDRNHHDMINIVFTISDTGIGIPEAKLSDIFEVSNIADNMKNNHAGIGVGLAIAKGYTDLLGGIIEVESMYGAGSTFTVSLNQKIAHSIPGKSVITKIEDTVSKKDAEKLWLPDVNCLLVDDDEVSRDVSIKTLQKFEMKVDAASSGVSAIDMVLNNEYDVVFMDVSMPVMNGIEAMKEIRELNGNGYEYMSIVAMDSDAIEENRDKLLEEGFTDSLIKPMDLRRVAAILKDCLPLEKIKERGNGMEDYLKESRFGEGIEKLREVLDVETALEKMGGSIDVYNKLINIFYNQNSNSAQELYEKSGKDTRGFRAKIHAIKINSLNIGATKLGQEAAKMEAAINIGNREYAKENLDKLIDDLVDVLLLIEDYIEFVKSVSGISDEEYAARKAQEVENAETEDTSEDTPDHQSIDPVRLENIKYTALDGEYEAVMEELAILEQKEYVGEDKEFMEVLKAAIDKKDTATIDDIVTTYLDLML